MIAAAIVTRWTAPCVIAKVSPNHRSSAHNDESFSDVDACLRTRLDGDGRRTPGKPMSLNDCPPAHLRLTVRVTLESPGCQRRKMRIRYSRHPVTIMTLKAASRILLTLLCWRVACRLPALAQSARNPIIQADVPDISMIRVGDAYYMSSTTMHMSPGLPIMKSTDLVNWRMLNYAYERLGENEELNMQNGSNAYGRGSWASSIRYNKGVYYVSTFSATTGKTYIFHTTDIEKEPWQEISFEPSLHDSSLFFDDDGKVYMLWGAGRLQLVELKEDLTGIKEGGQAMQLLRPESSSVGFL